MSSLNVHVKLPFRKSHAFIIGINDYQHISKLRTAANDARGLAQRLEEEHGYTVHPPLINATKDEIMHWLKTEIPQQVKPKDRVLFYFAGHGIALNSDQGPDGYLVPSDAKLNDLDSLVKMDTLHETINNLPCKHGLLILDCCFAGAFRWSATYRDVVMSFQSVLYEERFWQYTKDEAWQVITSSASDQKASDALPNLCQKLEMEEEDDDDIDETQHSPFALALFDAIEGAADLYPKGLGDGVITGTELFTYIRDRVEDETMDHNCRQSPSFFTLEKHNKGQYVFISPRHPFNLPPVPDRNPFMGMGSFEEKDSDLFFGRKRVIQELEEKIEKEQLIVVTGESGTGKSSVIKAGLVPGLREMEWRILPIIRPGKEPMENLKEQIPNIKDHLTGSKPSLLVIDQYEELITECLNPLERITFEKQLASWLKEYPQLKVVISVRADFEMQFSDKVMKSWWERGRYPIPAFTQEELREIIVKPITQEVLFFEPATLVDQMVDAVNDAPKALPMLSFTLSELYYAYLKSGRNNRSLTEEDYDEIGGVSGAIKTKAENLYHNLDETHKNSLRKLMLRMVSMEAGELTSRRVLTKELIYSDEKENERIQVIIQQLIESRLIHTGINHEGRPYIEPTHNALVQTWERLKEWVTGIGVENLRLLYKLDGAQEDFEENLPGRKARHFLWHDNPRLDLLDSFLRTADYRLNIYEERFVNESIALRKSMSNQRKVIRIGAIAIAMVALTAIFFFADSARDAKHALEEEIGKSPEDTTESASIDELMELLTKNARTKDSLEKVISAIQLAEAQKAQADAPRIHSILRYKSQIEPKKNFRGARQENSRSSVVTSDTTRMSDPIHKMEISMIKEKISENVRADIY